MSTGGSSICDLTAQLSIPSLGKQGQEKQELPGWVNQGSFWQIQSIYENTSEIANVQKTVPTA